MRRREIQELKGVRYISTEMEGIKKRKKLRIH